MSQAHIGLEVKTEGDIPMSKNFSKPGYITANPKKYRLIKEMRDFVKSNPTKAEQVMWEYLRNKKTGHKIRRQHIIDVFITDFVCLRKKLVIEIDGKIHLKQKEYDEMRTVRLNELGYEVIRFKNEEVFANPELVAKKIKEKLDSKSDSDLPKPLQRRDANEVFSPEEKGIITLSFERINGGGQKHTAMIQPGVVKNILL